MNGNDFTVLDAQCAFSELFKIDPTEIVDLDSGVVTSDWQELNVPNE